MSIKEVKEKIEILIANIYTIDKELIEIILISQFIINILTYFNIMKYSSMCMAILNWITLILFEVSYRDIDEMTITKDCDKCTYKGCCIYCLEPDVDDKDKDSY